jgi:hypothetical protein
MSSKETNLCVAADVTDIDSLLKVNFSMIQSIMVHLISGSIQDC